MVGTLSQGPVLKLVSASPDITHACLALSKKEAVGPILTQAVVYGLTLILFRVCLQFTRCCLCHNSVQLAHAFRTSESTSWSIYDIGKLENRLPYASNTTRPIYWLGKLTRKLRTKKVLWRIFSTWVQYGNEDVIEMRAHFTPRGIVTSQGKTRYLLPVPSWTTLKPPFLWFFKSVMSSSSISDPEPSSTKTATSSLFGSFLKPRFPVLPGMAARHYQVNAAQRNTLTEENAHSIKSAPQQCTVRGVRGQMTNNSMSRRM